MREMFQTIIDSFKWIMPTSKFYFSDLLQIVIIFFTLYYIIKNLRNTRAWVIAKGLFVIFIIYSIVYLTSLTVIQYLLEQIFAIVTVAIVIMFQPELRKLIESFGKKDIRFFTDKIKKDEDANVLFTKKTIDEVVIACSEMSKAKTGALIVFEREIPLTDYINSGIELNANITNQLLINTFEKNTPLHDGAVIVQQNKLKAATCYLPLSDNHNIKKSLGTRHRAGIGITENTDAFVVIVSEETGNISWCEDGKIKHNVSSTELSNKLSHIAKKEVVKNVKKNNTTPLSTIVTQITVAIASVFLWAIVLNINDQVITNDFYDIPVKTLNTDVINEVGQTYQIKEGETIDITIKGKRSIVENITQNDIIAIANFEKLSYVYSVPIEISLSESYNNMVEIKKISTDTMVLELEELVEAEIPIEVKTIGETNPDYYISIDTTTPNLLKVVGAKSKINILDKAVVSIDVTDKTTNFISSVEPILYDKNGTIMKNDLFTFNSNLVKVNAVVYETKKVPINVYLQNNETNAFYYELIDYTIEDDMVSVAASDDILENIETLSIPIELTDNNDVTTSILINLNNYLPNDVFLGNNQNQQIQLTLNLNKYERKNIPITKDDIKITYTNKQKNMEYKIINAPNQISTFINNEVIPSSDINIELLNPAIKIEEEKPGIYSTTLKLTNIDGVRYMGEFNIEYSIEGNR